MLIVFDWAKIRPGKTRPERIKKIRFIVD